MQMISPSAQQGAVIQGILHWFKHDSKQKQVCFCSGYAGTGKTTIAKIIKEEIGDNVRFAAYTGKAALVLKKKGCGPSTTIHSLIYKAEVDEETGQVSFRLNKQSALADADLLILDECSMVNEDLARDLLSFKTPILVLGDPGQLPPPDGAGYFNATEPDFMLTEIHRQARDNPIIWMATEVRNGRKLRYGTYGDSSVIEKASAEQVLAAEQIVVGRHVTREGMNGRIRKLRGFTDEIPMIGERLMCLRNDKNLGIFNGGMFDVKKVDQSNRMFLKMDLDSLDIETMKPKVKVHRSFFQWNVAKPKDWKILAGSQEFDYGYSLTAHKSQGSQWDNLVVFDEAFCFRDQWGKWLYTAITRAAEKVIIVRDR